MTRGSARAFLGLAVATACSPPAAMPPALPIAQPATPYPPAPVTEQPAATHAAPASGGASEFPAVPDLEASQHCVFTDHGMMAQSLVIMRGDLDMGPNGPRALRSLVNIACSFDQSKCTIAALWVDEIDHDGKYRKLNQIVPASDDRAPTVAHGKRVATIQQYDDTWTVDAVAHRVTYVHASSDVRAEGVCVDRPPPMFEGVGVKLPASN